MQRELLLIGEMIEAAEQAESLIAGTDVEALRTDASAATRCCGTSPCSARRLLNSTKR